MVKTRAARQWYCGRFGQFFLFSVPYKKSMIHLKEKENKKRVKEKKKEDRQTEVNIQEDKAPKLR